MASEEEREAMAAMCIWVGDTKAAKLFSMSTLMYHLVARSIEAASLRKSRIGLVRKEESGNKYSILNIGMERTKTETSMNLTYERTVFYRNIFGNLKLVYLSN